MWQRYMESARASAREIEELTYRISNGGGECSGGDRVSVRSSNIGNPTERDALVGLTVIPQLEEQRRQCERIVGNALKAIETVRKRMGQTEADILDLFYIDGNLSGAIAEELGMTVDGFFYRKRKILKWMDENLTIPK